jgi:hypothetical protein
MVTSDILPAFITLLLLAILTRKLLHQLHAIDAASPPAVPPAIKAKYTYGSSVEEDYGEFQLKRGKVLVLITPATCPLSKRLVRAAGVFAKSFPQHRVIISGQGSSLKRPIIADSMGRLIRSFSPPFVPYAYLLENGIVRDHGVVNTAQQLEMFFDV